MTRETETFRRARPSMPAPIAFNGKGANQKQHDRHGIIMFDHRSQRHVHACGLMVLGMDVTVTVRKDRFSWCRRHREVHGPLVGEILLWLAGLFPFETVPGQGKSARATDGQAQDLATPHTHACRANNATPS